MMKRLALSLALLVATALPATAQVRVGEPAPDFEGTFSRLDANRLSELRGRTVLIDFWRTW